MQLDDFTSMQIDGQEITELRINDVLVWKKNTISNDLELSFTGSNFNVNSSSQGLTGQNIIIDWGDGTTTNYTSVSDLNHTYSVSGNYSIKISRVTSLGAGCFSNCSGLTSIEIPNNITSLGSNCFYGCSGLTSIVIPNSVTKLEIACFSNCSGLTSVEILEGVTSLGNNCFRSCSGLTSIEIPDSVASIGTGCFYSCTSLTSLVCNWTSNPPSYNSTWIANANSSLKFNIPYGTTSIYTDAGYPLDKLEEREEPYLLSVTSDKDILSYYDNDVANLTVNYTKNGTPYDGTIFCSTFPDFFDGTNLYIPFETGDEDWIITLNGTFDILNEDKTLYDTLTSSQMRYVQYQNGVVTTVEYMQDESVISLPTKGFFLVTPEQLMDSMKGFVSLGGPSFGINSMSNGVMNASYNSKGVGDVTFYFYLEDGTLLQETYNIEDITYFNDGSSIGSLEVDSDVSCTSNGEYITITTSTSGEKYVKLPITLLATDNWEYSVEIAKIGTNQSISLNYMNANGWAGHGEIAHNWFLDSRNVLRQQSQVGDVITLTKRGNKVLMKVNGTGIAQTAKPFETSYQIGFYTNNGRIQHIKNIKLRQIDVTLPSPPLINNIVLTSDKSILSAYDSDTCILTATVNGTNVDGLEVEFFNGTTSLGTSIITNGVATKSYTATGVGNISVSAECEENTSNTVTIEDCLYHNDGTSLSNITIDSGVSCTVSDGALRIAKSTSGDANVTIPKTFISSDNFIVEWEVACEGTGQRSGFWLNNATTASGLWCCYESGHFIGNSKVGNIPTYTTSLNVGDKIYLKQENGVVTLSKNDETFFSKSISFSSSTYKFGYYTNSGRVQCVDNIKIKPL